MIAHDPTLSSASPLSADSLHRISSVRFKEAADAYSTTTRTSSFGDVQRFVMVVYNHPSSTGLPLSAGSMYYRSICTLRGCIQRLYPCFAFWGCVTSSRNCLSSSKCGLTTIGRSNAISSPYFDFSVTWAHTAPASYTLLLVSALSHHWSNTGSHQDLSSLQVASVRLRSYDCVSSEVCRHVSCRVHVQCC